MLSIRIGNYWMKSTCRRAMQRHSKNPSYLSNLTLSVFSTDSLADSISHDRFSFSCSCSGASVINSLNLAATCFHFTRSAGVKVKKTGRSAIGSGDPRSSDLSDGGPESVKCLSKSRRPARSSPWRPPTSCRINPSASLAIMCAVTPGLSANVGNARSSYILVTY